MGDDKPKSPEHSPREKSTSPKSGSPGPAIGALVTQPDVLPAADPDDADAQSLADSAFSSTGSLSTESISSSVYAYRVLHGRTYNSHSATSVDYWAPNDDRQNEGLDLMHNSLTIVLEDRLFLAPIDPESQPLKVLDLGTGTGCWAIDFGDAYPMADVLGTDISPIQQTWVSPNVRFQIDDFLKDWTWPEDTFDYVHMRALYGSVPDWDEHYAKAFRVLTPGGWLEHLETDVECKSDHVRFPEDHILPLWGRKFREVGEKAGKTFAISDGHRMRDAMLRAGFVDVQEVKLKMPSHAWPRDKRLQQAGLFCLAALDESLEGYAMYAFTTVLGWTQEQVYAFVAEMRREMRKRSNCAWLAVTVVYGRKPEE